MTIHLNQILKNTEYNPIPEGVFAGYVQTPDRKDIRFARWKAMSHPSKGTILLLHGRTEFIEKTFETVTNLRQAGFEVLTFDWRGQGGSSRLLKNPRAGYIDDYEDYVTDLETIFQSVALPDCKGPYYIVAHSTGALISLFAAPKFGNKIRRMVLCSPFLGITGYPITQRTIKILSASLYSLGMGTVYLAGSDTPDESKGFSGNIYTNDLRRFSRNRKLAEDFRELTIGGITAAWVYASIRCIEEVFDPDFHDKISIPTLLIAAGNDQIVPNSEVEVMGRYLRTGTTLTIDGARHEMFQEHDKFREQLLAAITAFIPGSDTGY